MKGIKQDLHDIEYLSTEAYCRAKDIIIPKKSLGTEGERVRQVMVISNLNLAICSLCQVIKKLDKKLNNLTKK